MRGRSSPQHEWPYRPLNNKLATLLGSEFRELPEADVADPLFLG